MKISTYFKVGVLAVAGLFVSCRDESLYPLPYDDREVGAYMRAYSQTSNIIDLNNLANSGFDILFEAVDEANGENLQEFRFFVSHRRGTAVTPEVAVKVIPASNFTSVPDPTVSPYKRGRVRITGQEALTVLSGAPGFPGSFAIADQVNFRGIMVLKDGREFTTTNTTPNITGGQFYSAPFIWTLVVRSIPAGSWVGTYRLAQAAIWSPSHSPALHATPQFPAYLNQVLFPTQDVTLSVPTGGLSTERVFQVQYRGQTVSMRINLEPTPTQADPNLATVFVPLQNTGVDCTAERELYWVTPVGGTFGTPAAPPPSLPAGLPQAVTANRGTFNNSQTGLVAGQLLSIGVDDDADEYGRRNGYCTWTRRVRLTLTKL